MCEEALQPIRDRIGQLLDHDDYFIKITSGFRCEELNKKVGGAKNSFHRFGYAADCELYIDGKECNALLFHVVKTLGFYTELIWEFGESNSKHPHKAYPAWVHIAYKKNDPRKEIKIIQ